MTSDRNKFPCSGLPHFIISSRNSTVSLTSPTSYGYTDNSSWLSLIFSSYNLSNWYAFQLRGLFFDGTCKLIFVKIGRTSACPRECSSRQGRRRIGASDIATVNADPFKYDGNSFWTYLRGYRRTFLRENGLVPSNSARYVSRAVRFVASNIRGTIFRRAGSARIRTAGNHPDEYRQTALRVAYLFCCTSPCLSMGRETIGGTAHGRCST